MQMRNILKASRTECVVASENTRYNVNIDEIAYITKPSQHEVRNIKNRIADIGEPQSATLEDIIDAIKHGHTICPAQLNLAANDGHKAKYWESQQLFFIDIDNTMTIEEEGVGENGNLITTKKQVKLTDDKYISVAKAQQILTDNNINAFFIYKSFSYQSSVWGQPPFEKYRICIKLDTLITDTTERSKIVQALIALFGEASDNSCKNADRIFFGSTSDCELYKNLNAVTAKNTVLQLYDKLCIKPVSQSNTIVSTKAPNPLTPVPSTTTLSDSSINQEWWHVYDYDINYLLSFIDSDSYDIWKDATIAYKSAGGDVNTWIQWSSQSVKWQADRDIALWNNITSTDTELGKRKLIQLAGETDAGQRYMKTLRDAQAEAKQQYKEQQKNTKKSKAKATETTVRLLTSKKDINDEYTLNPNVLNIYQSSFVDEFNPQFVYYPYIPIGDYTVVVAEGGIGKSTFCCGIAAAISTGALLPGETEPRTPGKVLYISTEDPVECISTRTKKCNANSDNILIMSPPESYKVAFYGDGLQRLQQALQAVSPTLVIFDPWQSFINPNANVNNMLHMRNALQVLPELAKQFNCGIMLIAHTNKNTHGENANNAASGSAELINMARSAIKIEYGKDPNNKNNIDVKATGVRLAIHTKTNYANLGKTLMYNVIDGYVTWTGFSNITRSTLEEADKQNIAVADLIKKQDTTKTNYKLLIDTIVHISEQANEFPITVLYEDLEAYNTDGLLWNGEPVQKKSSVLKEVSEVLQADYKLTLDIPSSDKNHYRSSINANGKNKNGRGFRIFRYNPAQS